MYQPPRPPQPPSSFDTYLWERQRIVRSPAPPPPTPNPFLLSLLLPPPPVSPPPQPSFEAMRPRIFKRDGYRCRYCEAPATEVDHIKPRSRGGSSWASNLVASCEACNDVAGSADFGSFLRKRAAIRTIRFGRP